MTESILIKLNVTSPYSVLLMNDESIRWLLIQIMTTNGKKISTHHGSETEWKKVRTVAQKSADKVTRSSEYAEERGN
jgi:aerobic-type carbon monoxide dehydrogenase small subunit (CoxS/CutS family)